MRTEVKKLIAREGLVILGILVVGVLIYNLPSLIFSPKSKIQDNGKVLKLSQVELGSLREKYPEYDDLGDLALAEKLAKKYPEYQSLYENIAYLEVIETLTRGQFDKARKEGFSIEEIIEFEKRRSIDSFERKRGAFEDVGFFILFLGYPCYLLICFIVWAIKTLREK